MFRMDASGGSFFGNRIWFGIGFAIAMLFASQAAAYECTFTTECMGSDGCSESSFAISGDIQMPVSAINTDFGNYHGTTLVAGDVTTIHAHVPGSGDSYLLSMNTSGGTSHLSVHMPTSEMALYYSGTCEAAQ